MCFFTQFIASEERIPKRKNQNKKKTRKLNPKNDSVKSHGLNEHKTQLVNEIHNTDRKPLIFERDTVDVTHQKAYPRPRLAIAESYSFIEPTDPLHALTMEEVFVRSNCNSFDFVDCFSPIHSIYIEFH